MGLRPVRLPSWAGLYLNLEEIAGLRPHETPAVIEADRITGQDCFLARVVVKDTEALQAVVDRFQPHAAVNTAITLAQTVMRRLPNFGDF